MKFRRKKSFNKDIGMVSLSSGKSKRFVFIDGKIQVKILFFWVTIKEYTIKIEIDKKITL